MCAHMLGVITHYACLVVRMQLEYFIDKDDVTSRHLASKLTMRLPIMRACDTLGLIDPN